MRRMTWQAISARPCHVLPGCHTRGRLQSGAYTRLQPQPIRSPSTPNTPNVFHENGSGQAEMLTRVRPHHHMRFHFRRFLRRLFSLLQPGTHPRPLSGMTCVLFVSYVGWLDGFQQQKRLRLSREVDEWKLLPGAPRRRRRLCPTPAQPASVRRNVAAQVEVESKA
jgi:hypothetical protein